MYELIFMCLNPLKITVKPFLNSAGKKELVIGNFFDFTNEKTGEVAGHYLVPCGSCPECRAMKRREWSERLMLEASLYPPEQVYMVTLTYDDVGILDCSLSPKGLRSLNYEHFRTFCRRIRDDVRFMDKRSSDFLPGHSDKLRYFCAMEYGDRSMRPHGHAILFGIDLSSLPGNIPISVTSEGTLFNSSYIGDLWHYGNNSVCLAEPGSISYVAGYVTKKLQKRDDYDRFGILPEKSFMSSHPAIGVRFFEENKDLIRESGCYINPFTGQMHSIPRYALRTVFADDPGFCAIVSHNKQISAVNQLNREDFDRGERSEDARARVFNAKIAQKRSIRKL